MAGMSFSSFHLLLLRGTNTSTDWLLINTQHWGTARLCLGHRFVLSIPHSPLPSPHSPAPLEIKQTKVNGAKRQSICLILLLCSNGDSSPTSKSPPKYRWQKIKKSTLMHIGILWAHTKPNSCIVFVIVKKSGIGANFIFYFNSIEYFPIIV